MQLTYDQKARLKILHKEGKTAATIAVYLNAELGLNLKATTIYYMCGKLGLAQPLEESS